MKEYVTRENTTGLLYGLVTVGMQIWGRYKSWWWYDNVAHFSAGLSLGSLVATEDSSTEQDIAIVLALTFIWEVFEFVTNTYPWDGSLPERAAAEETILDSLLVTIGAWLASKWSK